MPSPIINVPSKAIEAGSGVDAVKVVLLIFPVTVRDPPLTGIDPAAIEFTARSNEPEPCPLLYVKWLSPVKSIPTVLLVPKKDPLSFPFTSPLMTADDEMPIGTVKSTNRSKSYGVKLPAHTKHPREKDPRFSGMDDDCGPKVLEIKERLAQPLLMLVPWLFEPWKKVLPMVFPPTWISANAVPWTTRSIAKPRTTRRYLGGLPLIFTLCSFR